MWIAQNSTRCSVNVGGCPSSSCDDDTSRSPPRPRIRPHRPAYPWVCPTGRQDSCAEPPGRAHDWGSAAAHARHAGTRLQPVACAPRAENTSSPPHNPVLHPKLHPKKHHAAWKLLFLQQIWHCLSTRGYSHRTRCAKRHEASFNSPSDEHIPRFPTRPRTRPHHPACLEGYWKGRQDSCAVLLGCARDSQFAAAQKKKFERGVGSGG